jgi:Fe-S-cluster containining protein
VELIQIASADHILIGRIDATLAEAAHRSGAWMACRPGCADCCLGPFAITQLDAIRLQAGLRKLAERDPEKAAEVRRRAREYVTAVAHDYPGDPVTGILYDEDELPASVDDAPCPALDPTTRLCDLYEARPITCRTFGPAVRTGNHTISHCELCFEGAPDEVVDACAVKLDTDDYEQQILAAIAAGGMTGATIVAYALANGR